MITAKEARELTKKFEDSKEVKEFLDSVEAQIRGAAQKCEFEITVNVPFKHQQMFAVKNILTHSPNFFKITQLFNDKWTISWKEDEDCPIPFR